MNIDKKDKYDWKRNKFRIKLLKEAIIQNIIGSDRGSRFQIIFNPNKDTSIALKLPNMTFLGVYSLD